MAPVGEFVALEMEGHGNAALEESKYGGVHRRYLNITGRWSARGTREVPLLTWRDADAALAAAAEAGATRSRRIVVSALGADTVEAGLAKVFSEQMRPALRGYLPYTAAAGAKLELDRVKTMQYAAVVITFAAASDGSEASTGAGQMGASLRANIGRGGVVSAAQYLTGKKARDIIERLMDGEMDCDAPMTLEHVFAAIDIAKLVVAQLAKRLQADRSR